MHYVYILRSKSHPDQIYIGSTQNLRQRLAEHNSGKSFHTGKFAPWNPIVYVAFSERGTAEKFERYLKTGSGRAFAQRHLFSRPLSLETGQGAMFPYRRNRSHRQHLRR